MYRAVGVYRVQDLVFEEVWAKNGWHLRDARDTKGIVGGYSGKLKDKDCSTVA